MFNSQIRTRVNNDKKVLTKNVPAAVAQIQYTVRAEERCQTRRAFGADGHGRRRKTLAESTRGTARSRVI